MKETYQQMESRHQAEFETLPIFYAFSTSQLDEALEARGLNRETMPAGTLSRLGSGALCLTSDKPFILSEGERMMSEKLAAIEDYDFAFGAFLYEMNNHEYFINYQGDWDVLSVFGLDDDISEFSDDKGAAEYMRDMGFGKETRLAYYAAAREHYRLSEEW